ncbi:MAG: metallophosphoesterase [Wenzhouxiangella sp.]|nr:MAG: metallophosphoesterase [Wenzhouxiangella sp.]
MQLPQDRRFTFIGDIHGQANTLLALLDKLGWKRQGGRRRPSDHEFLVFVGDLIDRGTSNLQTVETVRELVEQGDALCLMGNHEFNAVHYHTPDPDNPGEYLRPHIKKNTDQHESVLAELEEQPETGAEMLAWFRTLPLAVEHESWRCVHACWHPASLEVLERRGDGWFLDESAWVQSARRGEPEYHAVETLLKGPEHPLPGGSYFLDKDGHRREVARIRWWDPAPATLQQALLCGSTPGGANLDRPYENPHHPGYPADAPPVFFGHYWKEDELGPDRPNVACLDYRAGMFDKLVAYRLGDETALEAGRFVAQPVIDERPGQD